MDPSKLSQSDKLKIAEFIFAFESDTLIKSEGQDVLDLFKAHHVSAAEKTELEAYSIMILIKSEIEQDARHRIMREYFGGTLG